MRSVRNPAFERILTLSSEPLEREETVCYLTDCLKPIVKTNESVLICFPKEKANDLGTLAGEAVTRCDGVPVFWEKDLRWSTLLRLAFVSKPSTIIAPPLIVLGLSKLAAYKDIPLYFYNVILAGYPSMDWVIDGIEDGMDCKAWGFFGPGTEAIVSGFSCQCGRGIHIRDQKYGVEIVDENGQEVYDGAKGRIVLYHRSKPDTRFVTKAFGSIMTRPCPCGNPSPKIIDFDTEEHDAASLMRIAEDLLYWNSILECNVIRSEFGLEMEVISLQGEKLPKLPSCARLIVRPWNPETDVPMSLSAEWTMP